MPATEADAADLALLIEAARRAGDIALTFARRGFRTEWKPDGSPVTEADLAVNAHLHDCLRLARPDYGWLSEESVDGPARLTAERIFIVDPIDGTRAFADGRTDWSHALAVVAGHRVVAAAIFVPRRDALYTAALGGGAHVNGMPIACSVRPGLDGARVLAAKSTLDGRHWASGRPPPVERTFRSSIAYRLARVAEGRDEAMLTLRPAWEWDVAAGTLLVTEAGGFATDLAGEAPRVNAADPRIRGLVAGGAVQPALLAALAPRSG